MLRICCGLGIGGGGRDNIYILSLVGERRRHSLGGWGGGGGKGGPMNAHDQCPQHHTKILAGLCLQGTLHSH